MSEIPVSEDFIGDIILQLDFNVTHGKSNEDLRSATRLAVNNLPNTDLKAALIAHLAGANDEVLAQILGITDAMPECGRSPAKSPGEQAKWAIFDLRFQVIREVGQLLQ